MEYHEKIVLAVVLLLVGLAVYLAVSNKPAPLPAPLNVSQGRALVMNALSFGYSAQNYTYSFSETSDGYEVNYTLRKVGNQSMAEIKNPLSLKQIYFLDNDTIICINLSGNTTCSSVTGNSDLDNYLRSVRVKFINPLYIDSNKQDFDYLVRNKYVIFNSIQKSTVSGNSCTAVSYTLDFNNLSVSEGARFGISAVSPKIFDWVFCVSDSGFPYQRLFNYSYQGANHTYSVRGLSFSASSSPITAPSNLTAGVADVLLREKEQQIALAGCYVQTGDNKDKCIMGAAISFRKKEICEFAGGRRDKCLVALVPSTKDLTICSSISQPSYVDDCYLELGGAYKNSSYCSQILNVSKSAMCMNVSQTPAKTSINITDVSSYIDNFGKNTTNSTRPVNTNTTGNSTNSSPTNSSMNGTKSTNPTNSTNQTSNPISNQTTNQSN
ncbi:hypothetical protein HZC07_01435 [Candidatus Micrarchaeota archaeon]|nr:hypothetical protein [Candidatus Micrarchaeota archaeon]